ncbi:MAG: phosphoribosylglycinamide formyltransferase [Candidatus Izimaplasma sp.]|nr:phosphoribosylglycinamide formyltransferase [Candidatus Izimaplasma bacterium]
MTNIAVFASGTGSNFEMITKKLNTKNSTVKVRLLICDNPEAKVIKKAEKLQIKTYVFNPKNFKTKQEYEILILSELKNNHIKFIALAGYMRLIGNTLLNAYPKKIINIHPSLLPAFKGLDALGQAVKSKVRVTGITIHYIDEGMDTGEIIAQEPLKITPPYNRIQIEKRLHQLEHKVYPKVIKQLLEENNEKSFN